MTAVQLKEMPGLKISSSEVMLRRIKPEIGIAKWTILIMRFKLYLFHCALAGR